MNIIVINEVLDVPINIGLLVRVVNKVVIFKFFRVTTSNTIIN